MNSTASPSPFRQAPASGVDVAALRQEVSRLESKLCDLRREFTAWLERGANPVRPAVVPKEATQPDQDDDIDCALDGEQAASSPNSRRPLPENVVPVGRDVFTRYEMLPREATIDPALERATVEELNAALMAAFGQLTAH